MDVDGIVASWLAAYLGGDMAGQDLLAALHDLESQLRGRWLDARPRVATLIREVETALLSAEELADVETAGVRFLGAHPAQVMRSRGTPDWFSAPS